MSKRRFEKDYFPNPVKDPKTGKIIGEVFRPLVVVNISGGLLVYRRKVVLYFEGKSFEVEVDFADKCEYALLGREGFFDQFKRVDFNQRKHKIIFNV